ncbi:Protein TMEPAI [Merluccius polli]|uniref:Protein TMEPAI n=1 Tax=Merluccius polli TaxID=89951 RepID=A0AA47M4J4_MERPO|nr:Protein TMEPAI [Merluccius polli]
MPTSTPASGSANTQPNVICSCNCTGTQPQGMDISELEFVQIIIILVVMMVMVVVIICLLNHYRLSALAFLSRHSQARHQGHRDQATQLVCFNLIKKTLEFGINLTLITVHAEYNITAHRKPIRKGPVSNLILKPVMYGPQGTQERLVCNPPAYTQQQNQHLCRFQPTYPYLQQELINLPPSISLSDGEELPPYKGPCTLKLRDPEQQLELSRASVRAPPNRTVFDRNFIDIYVGCGTSFNSGVSTANARIESPPPTYNEVMGHYRGSAAFYSQYSNNNASSLDCGSDCGSDTGSLWLEYQAGRRDSESTAATSGGESRRKRHGGGEGEVKKVP